jgi:hypothetical protein
VRPQLYIRIRVVKVMIKVKLFLYLNKHHTVKTYGGVEIYLHAFLNSALDGGGFYNILHYKIPVW